MRSLTHLIILQLTSVLAHVGIASGYPQLRELYDSAVLASSFLAAVPLSAMLLGFIWGPIVRRIGLRASILLAVSGWSLTFALLGVFGAVPAAGIALRALHGVFDVAFVSLPLAVATRRLTDSGERRRFFGLFETSASIGAIIGPLTVGSLMLISLPWAFLALAAVGPAYLLYAWPKLPRRAAATTAESAPAASESGGAASGAPEAPRRRVAPIVLVPSLYAISVLILISASEAFVPEYVETSLGAAWLGKLAVAVYEMLVIAGVMLKTRLSGYRPGAPLLTGLVFGIGFLVSQSEVFVLPLLALSAVGIGMSLTMSHEFAAHTVGANAEGGMTTYASLRISGGIVGPYVAALGFPLLLLPLAAVSLVSAPLLRWRPRAVRSEPIGETGSS